MTSNQYVNVAFVVTSYSFVPASNRAYAENNETVAATDTGGDAFGPQPWIYNFVLLLVRYIHI